MKKIGLLIGIVIMLMGAGGCNEVKQWQTYKGKGGPGAGKHIVLVSGDEEYRSEEALPQLGKMLSQQYGFTCTVLFAQSPEAPGLVDPNYLNNIPGLETLEEADLMIISTRFRDLPDEQMQLLENYLLAGKPVIGLRTATHGFRTKEDSKWAHWSFNYKGEKTEWHGGFGEFILGTTWVSHHGWHKKESQRGIVVEGNELVRGIGEGEIWSSSDVYGVKFRPNADIEPVVMGQVLAGMNHDDPPIGKGPYEKVPKYGKDDPNFDKNDPMMPIAWTKSYQLEGGDKGKVFMATIGASVDFLESGVRTLLGNAVYWSLGMEVPKSGVKLEVVGDYQPTMYNFYKEDGYYQKKNIQVSDHDL
ncbi:ThuA domain-containing protein [Pelagicoccus mobilis]|uniref:ThuA domain-containing protein n=1 Tax=Pelagicoccus mobilis TaxID=415221 RepID=A0A934VQA7_9BACT|nr:ThuA domain-containing protein [Pelagicoccus mobilis]MBK1878152.1 ThuA domain-containing protein [Pelagicoccus mobilis]